MRTKKISSDIPFDSIHVNDELPELVAALIPYDAGNWQLAKSQLEPIARTGNRLALFKYGNTLDNLGDTVSAEHFWRLAVAGGDIKAGINLAILLKAEGRNHEEVIALNEAAIEAGNIDAIRNLALYIEDEDPAGAEALYRRAVDAGDAKSCANLALKYFTEGDIPQAVEFAELGISRGHMYSASVVALYHLRREEWELTLAAARRALTLANQDNVEDQKSPYNMIALSLIHLHRFDEGEKALQDCIEHGIPDTHELFEWLGLMREAHPEVGQALPTAKPRFCTECGKAVQPGNAFCANCGSPL